MIDSNSWSDPRTLFKFESKIINIGGGHQVALEGIVGGRERVVRLAGNKGGRGGGRIGRRPTGRQRHGRQRPDQTQQHQQPYAERLPDDLSNRQCFVLDPMLATGGSLIAAIEYLFARGAVDVTAVCLLGAPEGLAAVEKATEGRDVTIVLGALDEKLNEVGYIVPGLGDAGDRLYGTV